MPTERAIPVSKTVGLPAPSASFPAEAFDAVNQRMSRLTYGHKSAWHGFAAAWNGVACRLTAAHQHAEQCSRLYRRSLAH